MNVGAAGTVWVMAVTFPLGSWRYPTGWAASLQTRVAKINPTAPRFSFTREPELAWPGACATSGTLANLMTLLKAMVQVVVDGAAGWWGRLLARTIIHLLNQGINRLGSR